MGVVRTNHELRLKAFDMLQELKSDNISRKEIIDKIYAEFGINRVTLLGWHAGNYYPHGRKGIVLYKPELFYVLGALLGDGCLYRWKITNNYLILIGDQKFTSKYANMVTRCTGVKTKAYENRSKNVWFVRSNNFQLYSLFKKSREELKYLEHIVKQDKKFTLMLIEGFFDAEGCVKIVKEKVRKTPKICLDITNTSFELLEMVRRLLRDHLNIEAKYSIQESFIGKDGFRRQKTYHLRIYKKENVRKFFENIVTTKLKEEKIHYVDKWLNNGK